MLAVGSQFLYNGGKSALVNSSQPVCGHLQGDPTIFLGQEKPLGLQIRQKTTLGLDVRVRHLVTGHRKLPCDLTYSCHDFSKILDGKGREKPLKFRKILVEIK